MNRNKIRTIIAALSVTLMFTGCGAPAEVTAPTIHTEPVATTVAVTEPIPATGTLKDFEFGQEVWSVCQSNDGEGAYLIRYAVVGQNGEMVEVVPYFTSDVQQLKESMGDTTLIDMSQVYLDRHEAMVAVAEANGETFEEYWG